VGGKTPGSMPSDSTEIYRKYNNFVGYLEKANSIGREN